MATTPAAISIFPARQRGEDITALLAAIEVMAEALELGLEVGLTPAAQDVQRRAILQGQRTLRLARARR